MQRKVIISSDRVEVKGMLSDSATADAIWNKLPFTSEVNTWGDEIYFTVPVRTALEDSAREVVEKGDIGYWPSGSAFCIFFGPTPVSRQGEIRAAGKVNVFGKIEGDTSVLKEIAQGSKIIVKKED